MLRGIGRESGSLQSAKNVSSSQQQSNNNIHPYQMLPNSKTLSIGGDAQTTNNSLSINGNNEKLLYKGGSSGSRVIDNSNNGYLMKSAQSQVQQMH